MGNFKKSHKTLKRAGSLCPRRFGCEGALPSPLEGGKDTCSAGALASRRAG